MRMCWSVLADSVVRFLKGCRRNVYKPVLRSDFFTGKARPLEQAIFSIVPMVPCGSDLSACQRVGSSQARDHTTRPRVSDVPRA